MQLSRLRELLSQGLESTETAGAYGAALGRHEAFARHETAGAVLAALGSDLESPDHKDALTRALVAEHQRGDGKVWSGVLLVAFTPLMLRLRAYVTPPPFVEHDEVDHAVVESFLRAVAQVDPVRTSRICLRLRRLTERHYYRYLQTERRQWKLRTRIEEEPFIPESPPRPDDVIETLESGRKVARLADELKCARGLEVRLIQDTTLRRESLSAYLNRTYPNLGTEERRRLYQRLKRRRSRTLQQIRKAAANAESTATGRIATGGHR